ALDLSVVDESSGAVLGIAFTGNQVPGTEKIRTIAHAPDGSYTALRCIWKDFDFLVETVAEGRDLAILVTPRTNATHPGHLRAKLQLQYGAVGEIEPGDRLQFGDLSFQGVPRAESEEDYLRFDFEAAFGISTRDEDLESIRGRIKEKEEDYWQKKRSYGDLATAYDIVQNAVNWLVVYDPAKQRAVTPVARPWSYGWGNRQEGGYVQFCWDNFFVAYMHAIESPELAYNEVLELTRYIKALGFVPNYAGPGDVFSEDRSQPPVGTLMVKEIYKKYPNRWFLEACFDDLLCWHRWWADNRDIDGYLAWGSTPFSPMTDRRHSTQNNHQAAAYESGLDNSPMFDGVPYDSIRYVMLQADVGLMGLYVADADALAEIADVLGRSDEAAEIRQRADRYREKLRTLWNEEVGLFLNKRMDTGEWNYSISPTNFYALIGRAATQLQAERMIQEHFYNPEEFWGDFIMPSISRSDPGYLGRDYWRGSIWAPMNFLVYLGLRNYDLPQARKDLADKSLKLLVKNWNEGGNVLENYNTETGGYPGRSNLFYHWGALLGMINLMEAGHMAPTEAPLVN
ncbi:MAG: trehalase family glycosidase, partial [Bacteroidota bacterium]